MSENKAGLIQIGGAGSCVFCIRPQYVALVERSNRHRRAGWGAAAESGPSRPTCVDLRYSRSDVLYRAIVDILFGLCPPALMI
jgi:hypothetical protein